MTEKTARSDHVAAMNDPSPKKITTNRTCPPALAYDTHMTSPLDTPSRFLDPASAEAVDARFASGTTHSLGHSPRKTLASTHTRLDALLGLLDPSMGEQAASTTRKNALIATLCARASAQRRDDLAGAIIPASECTTLSHDSAVMTDAFVAGDVRPGPVASLLGLLDARAADHDGRRQHVIDRTLNSVQHDIERQGKRLRMNAATELHGARSRFNLRDLVASAAAILLGAAVLWPSATALRASERQQACTANLQQAGVGMGLFTTAEDQRLPSINDRADQPVWWNVGTPKHSHSANVFRLIAGGYTTMHSLACPCNGCAPQNLTMTNEKDWRAPEEVSYSYLLFARDIPRISSPGIKLLLVDKSPVVDRARLGETFHTDINSRNHGGRGQNALMADLSVNFLTHPVLEGDNIWVPRHLENRPAPMQGFTLRGTEQPADLADIFVGP